MIESWNTCIYKANCNYQADNDDGTNETP